MASIRTATPEDAASIARVQVETWNTTYRGIVPDSYLANLSVDQRTLRWREILSSGGHTAVAEFDGQVAGFISGGPIRDPIDHYGAELYAIYLLEAFQRKGMGTALLVELACRLSEEGFGNLAVWVFEANPAVRFYAETGAIRIGAKEHEIEGVRLPLVAYGWPSLKRVLADLRHHAAAGRGQLGHPAVAGGQ